METFFKQFGDWVTALRHNLFLSARIKLTFFYIAIISVITLGFSGVLYESVRANIYDISFEHISNEHVREIVIAATLDRAQDRIMLIDLVVILSGAFIAFILAGYTLRPIQETLERQKRFTENASHELRTPLTIIRNETEVLLRNPNPQRKEVEHVLKSTIEEIDKLSDMTENLLVLARSEKVGRSISRLSAKTLIANMVDRMNKVAVEKGVTIRTAVDEVTITGNERELERILINLIHNAIQHTSHDGLITVSAEKDRSQCIIMISDTGRGIAPEELPHIFNRFYKGSRSQGTGLGLSIVDELVRRHKGTISVESEVGKGTTMRVVLGI